MDDYQKNKKGGCCGRSKKDDKAKRNRELHGHYTAKRIRQLETRAERAIRERADAI